ncbi:uncharacterized protein [Heterodontus francisci]|uniref:uncharacterized protein n=1 Tax=Heterodontus francisci TaxID=7792 RepID=UPI00355C3C9A
MCSGSVYSLRYCELVLSDKSCPRKLRLTSIRYPVKQAASRSSQYVFCESTLAKCILQHLEMTTPVTSQPSPKDHSEDLSIPVASAVQQAEEAEECKPQEEVLMEEMPVQDPTPTTSVSTDQVHRKRLAKTSTNEIPPKRRKHLSAEVSPISTASTGCKYTIKKTPVRHRMSAGHFSAWGVEEDEVLYYMQKDTGDGQSADAAFVPTSCQEAPKSPQCLQNSSDNYVKQKERYTISPFRAVQTSTKQKHYATWMRSNTETSSKTLFYTQLSEKLVNTVETSSSTGFNNCDEKNPPNSPEIWLCDTCSFSNKVPAIRCGVCDTLKYGVITQSEKRNQSNEMSTDKCEVNNSTLTTSQITSSGSTETGLPGITSSHPKPRPVGVLMGKWAQRKYLKKEGDCMDPEFTCPTHKTCVKPEVLKAIWSILQQPFKYNWNLY